jgi:hypothetical protein
MNLRERTPEEQALLEAGMAEIFERGIPFNHLLGLKIVSARHGQVQAHHHAARPHGHGEPGPAARRRHRLGAGRHGRPWRSWPPVPTATPTTP